MSEGNSEVEQYMPPVKDAIATYVKWPSNAFTAIYNRAYEAVSYALDSRAAEIERLRARIDEATKVVDELEGVLPDSSHIDKCWDWAWDELDGDAQDAVKEKRGAADTWLESEAAHA